MSAAWRREVPELGARGEIRTHDPDDDAPPGSVTLRVLRGVAHGVLARQLVGNLSVDAGEIGDLVREERPSAGFLGELPHHEFRFLETLGRDAGSLARREGRWSRSRSRTVSRGPALPRTAAGSRCPRRPTARRWPDGESRRCSSRRLSSGPSARYRRRCTTRSSRRPTSGGSPVRARPKLLVKLWRTTTRLSKSTTSARSCCRSRLAKPMAASCAVCSFVLHARAGVDAEARARSAGSCG